MRLLFGATIALAVFLTPAWAAKDKDNKDPPFIKTVKKKLQTKVTVDYKDTMLREVVADLKGQVDNLSIYINTANGLSQNQRVTYKAKDKPIDEVLTGMFKGTDLSWTIGREKDRRYKGWVIIRKGAADDDEEKPATKPEGPEKKPKKVVHRHKKPKTQPEEDDPEAAAQRKLKLGKMLQEAGKADKAREWFEDIVKKYPKTDAAKEAQTLLDKLPKE